MTVFQAIVALTKASWQVLRRHRRLAYFPMLSLAATIVVFVIVTPLLGVHVHDDELPWPRLLLIGVLLQLVRVFFEAGLTHEALKALRGDEPSVRAGLGVAVGRLTAIATLAAITAPVGLVLGVLGRSTRPALRLARALFGTAWSLATYLAIPVMVQERRGGIPSLRRSGALFRRTWGETALSEVGVRVLAVHLVLVVVIVAIVLLRVLGSSVFAVLVLLAAITCVIGVVGALEAIYRAALYVFAAEGVVPEPFGGPELEDIWQVK
jgi:hypothetical protein